MSSLKIELDSTEYGVTDQIINKVHHISFTPDFDLVEDSHTWKIKGRDANDNEINDTLRAFKIDLTPPAIAIPNITEGAFYNHITPIIAITDANSDTSKTVIELNDAAYQTGTVIDSDGTYKLEVQAVDLAYNSASYEVNFHVDTTPPVILTFSPVDNFAQNYSSVTLSTTLYDSGAGIDTSSLKIVFNGNICDVSFGVVSTNFQTVSVSYSTTFSADGIFPWGVLGIKDRVGNIPR